MSMKEQLEEQPCGQVRARLREYDFARALDDDRNENADLHAHLDRCPLFRDFEQSLRTTRTMVGLHLSQPVGHFRDEEAPLNLWEGLSARLTEDRARTIPCADTGNPVYDDEFLSAYLDGELPLSDPQTLDFERHLVVCSSCNDRLGRLAQVSQTLRGFGYRLEECCQVDLAASVLETLRNDEGSRGAILESTDEVAFPSGAERTICPEMTEENLSAFLDGQLPNRETMMTGKHVENCPACRAYARDLHLLSDALRGWTGRLEAQAPELWPLVLLRLQNEATVSPSLTPLSPVPLGRRRGRFAPPLRHWFSSPAVAAVIGLLVVGALVPNWLAPQSPVTIPQARMAARPVSPLAPSSATPQSGIASRQPLEMMENLAMTTSRSQDIPPVAARQKELREVSASKALPEPTLAKASASTRGLASDSRFFREDARPLEVASLGVTQVAYSPSSEEYLFSRGEQYMTDDAAHGLLTDSAGEAPF